MCVDLIAIVDQESYLYLLYINCVVVSTIKMLSNN